MKRFRKDDIIDIKSGLFRCILADKKSACFGRVSVHFDDPSGDGWIRTSYEDTFLVSNVDDGDGFEYERVKNQTPEALLKLIEGKRERRGERLQEHVSALDTYLDAHALASKMAETKRLMEESEERIERVLRYNPRNMMEWMDTVRHHNVLLERCPDRLNTDFERGVNWVVSEFFHHFQQ